MSYEDLSREAMKKLCRKAGAKRVSRSAAEELAKILEEVGVEIAKEAIKYTAYAGRRTLRAKDVKAAYEKTYKHKKPYSTKR